MTHIRTIFFQRRWQTYNNIITNPSYKQNNKINELIICCSCAKTVKGKTLLDTNSNMYKVEEIILQPNDS